MQHTAVLVVAAGRGTRLPGDVPKQYRPLGGRPVLRWSLGAFAAHPAIARVQAVTHPDDVKAWAAASRGLDLPDPVAGGASRQESVLRGLEALAGLDRTPDRVLIHDGARPFVSGTVISAVVAALDEADGALPVLPVTDTLKRWADGHAAETVDRCDLYRAQTPQGFRFAAILDAHRALAGGSYTDDAAIAEAAGLRVVAVPGEEANVKITHNEDMLRAEERLAGAREFRTGSGFDVHAFAEGNHVRLCGVDVPHTHALAGHSDADVGLHALTDAILGAIGAGDIGLHFPPSDPQWRGAASDRFLRHAAGLLAARGGALVHVDVTLICERPKVGPHRDAMRAAVASILELPVERVSVKATTTEGLGFTGRGEGIAAQATATVTLPGVA